MSAVRNSFKIRTKKEEKSKPQRTFLTASDNYIESINHSWNGEKNNVLK